MQIVAHQLVNRLAGVSDVTGHLGQSRRRCRKGKGPGRIFQGLFLKLGKIDRGPVQTRRRAGFHAPQGKAQFLEMGR